MAVCATEVKAALVLVWFGVGVNVLVAVAVKEGVMVGVFVAVGVLVGVSVGVEVGVRVGKTNPVAVGPAVDEGFRASGVRVGSAVNVPSAGRARRVAVGLGVGLGICTVGLSVGSGKGLSADSGSMKIWPKYSTRTAAPRRSKIENASQISKRLTKTSLDWHI